MSEKKYRLVSNGLHHIIQVFVPEHKKVIERFFKNDKEVIVPDKWVIINLIIEGDYGFSFNQRCVFEDLDEAKKVYSALINGFKVVELSEATKDKKGD